MEQPAIQPLENNARSATAAPDFVPYTPFAAAEQAIENHLGPKAKVLLPQQYREGFVRFLPWVAVLFLPLQLAGVLLLIGVSALAFLVGSSSTLGALVSVAVLVLDIIALPGLFKRTRRGWAFFTYALLVGALGNLLSFSIFGLAMSAGLLWLAFQVKYEYR